MLGILDAAADGQPGQQRLHLPPSHHADEHADDLAFVVHRANRHRQCKAPITGEFRSCHRFLDVLALERRLDAPRHWRAAGHRVVA